MAGGVRIDKRFVPSGEDGVELEIIVNKPPQAGPFPTILFNHGSTGRGNNRAMHRRTIRPAVIGNFFAERGWMTLFPQRRGRGKSGGVYAEGLAPDGSGYSCDADVAMAGFERAVEDMDAVVRALSDWPEIDPRRLLVGGVSRGEILAIAYAGMRPGTFQGAINFNGGWLGRACPSYEFVNPKLFERGAAAGISTLWLHGSQDQYYRMGHCRGNFERFLSSGGQGTFVSLQGGHALIFKPALWRPHLDRYLRTLFPEDKASPA